MGRQKTEMEIHRLNQNKRKGETPLAPPPKLQLHNQLPAASDPCGHLTLGGGGQAKATTLSPYQLLLTHTLCCDLASHHPSPEPLISYPLPAVTSAINTISQLTLTLTPSFPFSVQPFDQVAYTDPTGLLFSQFQIGYKKITHGHLCLHY